MSVHFAAGRHLRYEYLFILLSRGNGSARSWHHRVAAANMLPRVGTCTPLGSVAESRRRREVLGTQPPTRPLWSLLSRGYHSKHFKCRPAAQSPPPWLHHTVFASGKRCREDTEDVAWPRGTAVFPWSSWTCYERKTAQIFISCFRTQSGLYVDRPFSF